MRNNILNLKEEILRIKSLFTEERMFGNLVEDDPGCQCDDPKKEKYGKYNPTTSQCDPKLCENKDKDGKNVPAPLADKAKNMNFKTKADAQGEKEEMKADYQEKKTDYKLDEKSCKDHLKYMIKGTRSGKTKEMYQKTANKNGGTDMDVFVWCMKNHSDKWQNRNDGNLPWQKTDEIRRLYDTLSLPMPKWLSARADDGETSDDQQITNDFYDEEGAEGGGSGRIVVKNDAGRKIAIIHRKGTENKWTFRTPIKLKNAIPLIDKSDKGNIKFRDTYVNDIYKRLNIDPKKQRIVIQKAIETDGYDQGTFVLKNLE